MVFLPVGFMKGSTGVFYRQFAFTRTCSGQVQREDDDLPEQWAATGGQFERLRG